MSEPARDPAAVLAAVRAYILERPGVCESPHHGANAFRLNGAVFATLRADSARLMVKLDPEDTRILCDAHPEWIWPASGAWGRAGSTLVSALEAPESLVRDLIDSAWRRGSALSKGSVKSRT